jgi:signal transduction histidine kinase
MIRSLRVRLFLAVSLVAVVSLAVVGYLSSRITSAEFHKFLAVESAIFPEGTAAALLEYHDRNGGWPGVDALLAELGGSQSPECVLVLVDGQGDIAGVSDPRLAGLRSEPVPEGGLRLVGGGDGAGTEGRIELRIRGGGLHLEEEDGGRIGTVYILPIGLPGAGTAEAEFLGTVNRWLVATVAGAGVLALLLTVLLSRRILDPVRELTAAAREMEGGRLDRRVAVRSRDEIGELARAFNSMAEGLARVEGLRRRVVTDVAHELRTPLTSVRCQLETLQDGLQRPTRDVIDSLHEEVMSLGRLVDDLQDLALAEAGQLRLARRPVCLEEEAQGVVRSLRGAAAGESPTIEIALDDLPPVDADPDRLRQVLRNLLENALTHLRRDGKITISGRVARDEVEVTIRDTGPGIEPENLSHVFDRFYRADPSRQRSTGGAGIGLAIVKQIVEAHGGSVRAESRVGEGSSFSITLPVAAA